MNISSSKKWLRGASYFLIFAGLIHLAFMFIPPEPKNETEEQLLELISNYDFDVMGVSRSYDAMQRGINYGMVLFAVVVALLNLLLIRYPIPNELYAKVVRVNLLCAIIMFGLCLAYEIPPAMILFGILVLITGMAFVRLFKRT